MSFKEKIRAKAVPEILFNEILGFAQVEAINAYDLRSNAIKMAFCKKEQAIVALRQQRGKIGFSTFLSVWNFYFPSDFNATHFSYDLYAIKPVLEITAGPLLTNKWDDQVPSRGRLIVEDITVKCDLTLLLREQFLGFIIRIIAVADIIRRDTSPKELVYWESFFEPALK